MFKMLIIPGLLFLIALVLSGTNDIQQEKPAQQKDTIKLVWLTKHDWQELEKVTTRGKKTTAVVYQKTRLNIIHKVQYKKESMEFTKEQRKKLKEVLSKYEKK